MRYIQVIELESIGFTSCKIQGLPAEEITRVDNVVKNLKLTSKIIPDTMYEIDIQGITMLNILANEDFKICGQSMVIEKSNIGGRTIQIQKTVWTLNHK